MDQLRWNRIEALLQAALDVEDAGARAAFLRRECGSDEGLCHEVEELLAAEQCGMALESPAVAVLAPPPARGKQISHYRIEERLGAGGMGEVYLAHDDALQRRVALKTLPAEFTADAERVSRFEREAFAASRLNHPNIITIFEVVRGDGAHWIATEHVEGDTLRALLRAGTISIDRAVDITIQVAAALKAAHTAWIIHRDIKPENIMIRPDGVVKVLDFGIAKLSEADDVAPSTPSPSSPSSNLTVPGAVLGTATYMSPEQARGEPLDGRTDLYSLGLILREMLVSARIPKALARITEKLTRADRNARYGSAAELLDDLVAVRRQLETTTARRIVGFSIIAAAIAVAFTAVAAFLSVQEHWDERVLRDGHTAAARRAVFSPDGRRVATTGEDGQVILWDFETRERIASLQHRADMLVFAPDGRSLLTGGHDGTIAIWDAQTLTRMRVMQHGSGPITGLGISDDGRWIGSADRRTRIVWDAATGRVHRRLPIGGVSYGNLLFVNRNRQVIGWLVDTSDAKGEFDAEMVAANWIAISPDQTRIAGVTVEGDVKVFALEGGRYTTPTRVAERRGHQDHGRAIAYSPDGRLLASGADDIVLWDAGSLEKLARFGYEAIVWSVAFSPDGRWLISSHGDGAVLIWDVAERRCTASLNAHSAGVRSVAFTPDGRQLASGGEDQSVIIWDVASGRKQRVLGGYDSRVMGVAFAPDGRSLASVDQAATRIRIWDLDAARPRLDFRADEESSYCLAMSPDGRFVATTHGMFATSDGSLALPLHRQPWVYAQPYGIAYTPDSRSLVAVTNYGFALRFDLETRRLIDRHHDPSTTLVAASISPDGKWLVTGEDEGAIRLWTVDPLRPVAILGRHAARVKSVAFAPDGQTVASAGDDKRIALWDVRRRKLLMNIGTHTSPVYAVTFSRDGRFLASGEHDRSVRVYARRRTLWGYELGN